MSATPSATAKEFTVLMALLISIVAISIDALLPAIETNEQAAIDAWGVENVTSGEMATPSRKHW